MYCNPVSVVPPFFFIIVRKGGRREKGKRTEMREGEKKKRISHTNKKENLKYWRLDEEQETALIFH